MANIGKGGVQKYTLSVDGSTMGGSSLKQSEFKISFYGKENKNSVPTAYYTVEKSQATEDTEDPSGNTYFVVMETATLDLGAVCATLEVTYTDSATSKTLKEIQTLTTTDKIVEAFQPAEQQEEEEEVEQGGE